MELVGIESNRNGIGARLIATAENLQQIREIRGGVGIYQNELSAHFGLGRHTRVERLEIRWPSGQVDVITDIPADQHIRVFEGRSGYHVIRPSTWAMTDSLVAGSSVRLSASVRPMLFAPGAEISSIVADLSQLGGPREAPLIAKGDGLYELAEVLTLSGANFRSEVEIRIEQNTLLGTHWIRLALPVFVLPAGDLVIFDEESAAEWSRKAPGLVKINPTQNISHQGRTALEFRTTVLSNFEFQPPAPVDPTGYTSLRFAFFSETAEGSAFTVKIVDEESSRRVDLIGENIGVPLIDMKARQWQQVEIPLLPLQITKKLSQNT